MKTRAVVLASAGASLGLSFHDPVFSFFAWFAVAVLIINIWDFRGWSALNAGVIFGVAYFGTALYWVEHSVRVYGHIPFTLSIPTVLLLALVLSLYTGVFSVIFSLLYGGTRFPATVLAPLFWVSLELLRTYLLTGFPWASIAYSQYRVLPLIQMSDITGVYGVSFLIVAVNGVIADLYLYTRRKRSLPFFPVAPTIAGVIAVLLCVAGAAAYGTTRLGQKAKLDKRLRVTVVQGNIDQNLKWDENNINNIINTYYGLTRSSGSGKADLIVWPESTTPFVFGYDRARTESLRAFAGSMNTPILTGTTLIKEKSGKDFRLTNSAVLLGADGETRGVYSKIHLVPFGEYVPWGLPIGRLVTAIGDFTRGAEFKVMKAADVPFSAAICYEMIFPDLIRKFASNGARLLVSITNDAWFGRTAAPHQHFAMAVFRAVENRMPVARAANTGVSGFIDDRGRILETGPLFREEVLTRELSIREGKPSFYTRYGNVFGYLCVVAAIFTIIFRGDTGQWSSLKRYVTNSRI